VYGALGLTGVLLAMAFGHAPLSRPAWLPTQGLEAALASAVLGVSGAGLALLATRWLGRRASWAVELHRKLRPFVRDASDAALVALALASGIGEELFFRGFLAQTLGVVLSSIAFGLLHQVRGAGRWGWAFSAFVMGLFLASVFALSGSLVGPILAHVIVNAVNLRHLRDHDPDARPRQLGGLLRRS
jgi:membrane protease YdiL (CAAX protease family)